MTDSNPGWFAEWFDSPYYHLLYKNRDDSEAEFFMDRLSDYLNIQSGDKILDLPCGKGRHAIYLNKKGFEVVGADLSENSIQTATDFSNETLKFLVHDMRDSISFGPYNYILNLFTSFGYFEEQENIQVLQNMKNALAEGGKIVIDFMNTPKIVNSLVETKQKVVEGVRFLIRRFVRNGIIVKEISFEAERKSYQFEEQVRALTEVDFKKYFKATGLGLIEVFGNYNLEPYDSLSSERMIFVLS